MKNILKTGLLMSFIVFSMAACNEDEVEMYSGPDAVNLEILSRDSAEFSFLTVDPTTQEYVFNVEVSLQTEQKDKDREVNFVFGDRTTAKLGEHFQADTKVIIPAGKTSVLFPVKVFKAGLDTIEGGLTVELVVAHSVDFVGGVYQKMKLAFSGDYPKDWYSSGGDVGAIPFLIGKCTKAKYKFVFEHLKTVDLINYAGWKYDPILALQAELNAKLDQYATDHDGVRLKDDDGSDMWFSANT